MPDTIYNFARQSFQNRKMFKIPQKHRTRYRKSTCQNSTKTPDKTKKSTIPGSPHSSACWSGKGRAKVATKHHSKKSATARIALSSSHKIGRSRQEPSTQISPTDPSNSDFADESLTPLWHKISTRPLFKNEYPFLEKLFLFAQSKLRKRFAV